jgi:methyltransferase (TIGR00027 family)
MYVAELRYIQSIHESVELKNPDNLVGHFLPPLRRWRCKLLSRKSLSSLREDPFYYYLLARTKYYDQVFIDSIASGAASIINIGCGVDTRTCRFEKMLKENRIQVLECDQSGAISFKQAMARKVTNSAHVSYTSVDLNEDSWPFLNDWLHHNPGRTTVLMEGVSPYIDIQTFNQFLRFLGSALAAGSVIAYDFKVQGVSDTFGRVGRTQQPFRLSANRNKIEEYHSALGLRLISWEGSSELTRRFISMADPKVPLFVEDSLVQLLVS